MHEDDTDGVEGEAMTGSVPWKNGVRLSAFRASAPKRSRCFSDAEPGHV